MATQIQTNTFIGGMNRDSGNHIIDTKLYRYAENITVVADKSSEFGYIQPRDNIYSYNDIIPINDRVLGAVLTKITIDDITEDCLIVLTKYEDLNKLYRIVGLDTGTLELKDNKPYIEYDLDIDTECTIFGNVESSTISKIYICDGVHQLRIININEKEPIEVTDQSLFDAVPEMSINQPVFLKYIPGSLKASKVQYYARVFHKYGTSSTMSIGSTLIPVAKTPSINDANGGKANENTGNGVELTIDLSNIPQYFDQLLVFRVQYIDDYSAPKINVIVQSAFNNQTDYHIIDRGSSNLTEFSVEDFLTLLTNNVHYPKIIQPHGNIMFSANITESSKDIAKDYDTRAYRCDVNGVVHLDSSTGEPVEYSITDIIKGTAAIDKEHDCINPDNSKIGLVSNTYCYGKDNEGKLFLGGCGPNVSYKFIYTEVAVTNVEPNGLMLNDNIFTYTNDASSSNIVYARYGNFALTPHQMFDTTKRIPNYSDPKVCTICVGYQRDEVYAFGVVFYNSKGQRSSVKWIADIKMPSCLNIYATNDTTLLYPFRYVNYSDHYKHNVDLVGYALGIEFTFKNLPEDVVKYEIVRCDRTADNRSVVSQGILSNIWGRQDIFSTESNTWCTPWAWPFTAQVNGNGDYEYDNSYPMGKQPLNRVSNTYEYISPEGCFSQQSSEILKDCYVVPFRYLASYNGLVDGHEGSLEIGFTLKPKQTVHTPNSKQPIDKSLIYPAIARKSGEDKIIPDIQSSTISTMKYYFSKEFDKVVSDYKIVEAISGRTDIDQINLQTKEPYYSLTQNIQEWDYINSTRGDGFGSLVCWNFAAHGKNNVIKLLTSNALINSSIYTNIDYYTSTNLNDIFGCANTVPVCNIYNKDVIQYLGNTYAVRTNRNYISTGCISSNEVCACYGGDTYIGLLDHQTGSTEFFTSTNWEHGDEYRITHCLNSLIPLESTYNIDLRNDNSFTKLITKTKSLDDAYLISDMARVADWYVQEEALYLYNSVYSADGTILTFNPESLYSYDKNEYTNRVLASEPKVNNEVIDSWAWYKYANYIDIDTNHGQLTNLKSFFNKLYYFTETSVGTLSVNERSLITDDSGAQLILGTGGVLTRYDTVIDKNGSVILNDKSIVTSDTNIYWYDANSNEICRFGNGFAPLSKTKLVQSDLNKLNRGDREQLIEHKIPISFFDKKYNEIWIKVDNKPIVFNENLDVFTSYHTHNFDKVAYNSKYIVTFKDNELSYIHDEYGINKDPYDRNCKLIYVVNQNYANTKVFDNVWFTGELQDAIITDINFTTKTQESNHLDLSSIENREDNYRFYIPREQSNEEQNKLSMSFAGRMRGKYLVADYTFDCNNDKSFEIPFITTTYRYSRL